jgi:hypothetical protein
MPREPQGPQQHDVRRGGGGTGGTSVRFSGSLRAGSLRLACIQCVLLLGLGSPAAFQACDVLVAAALLTVGSESPSHDALCKIVWLFWAMPTPVV